MGWTGTSQLQYGVHQSRSCLEATMFSTVIDATLQYCPDTQKLKFTVRHGHEPDICNPVYV
jgi:hypothetical protein